MPNKSLSVKVSVHLELLLEKSDFRVAREQRNLKSVGCTVGQAPGREAALVPVTWAWSLLPGPSSRVPPGFVVETQ